jgi:hypothetical protein
VIVGESGRAPMAAAAHQALRSRGCFCKFRTHAFTPTNRDKAEWLDFSRGLVIEPVPVLPRPLLVASQATVPHCSV